jgi:hypothetical protein
MKGTPFFSPKDYKMFSRTSINSFFVFILLVVSLAMPSKASASAACYQLTLNASPTSGGSIPSASPDRSTGCPFHRYHPGEIITLTAAPNPGYSVGSWSGTNNNGSTSTTNTLTMPKKPRTVTVNYVVACYSLTRTHTGNGSDPAASPTESAGCPAGSFRYHAGEIVNLTATPDPGYDVLNWNGTANDASNSTTNSLTIQTHDATVTVNYVQVCFPLTLSHTGNGSDPVATPSNSAGCASGEYRSGESISLSATPASGNLVASWVGANNNTSTDLTNSLTMPNSDHTVTVNYVQDLSGLGCYYLTATHTGSGSDPVTSPLKSASCPTNGYYTSGELISLTATPSAGYVIAHWYGTDNDSLTTSANAWTMTAANHVSAVGYAKIITLVPLSVGTVDGWVLESTETSGIGGTLNRSDTTFKLGDDASDRQYRGILSFATGALPDNAVILSIKLRIRQLSLVGTNPFITHQGLKVDIQQPFFGTAVGLQLADFKAVADLNSFTTFSKTPVSGWYTATVKPTNFAYINLLGPTQLRLRFAKDDNDDLSADYLNFYSGNAAPTNRPKLIIQYYVP